MPCHFNFALFQLSGCPCTTLQSSLIIPTRSMQMKLIICFSGSLTSFLFESMLLFWMLRCVNVTVGLLNSRKWTALKWNKGGGRGMKMTKKPNLTFQQTFSSSTYHNIFKVLHVKACSVTLSVEVSWIELPQKKTCDICTGLFQREKNKTKH